MITHIEINGEQCDISNMSDEILILSAYIYDVLIKSWERSLDSGNNLHNDAWYRDNINEFKNKKIEKGKIVNKILKQRNRKEWDFNEIL